MQAATGLTAKQFGEEWSAGILKVKFGPESGRVNEGLKTTYLQKMVNDEMDEAERDGINEEDPKKAIVGMLDAVIDAGVYTWDSLSREYHRVHGNFDTVIAFSDVISKPSSFKGNSGKSQWPKYVANIRGFAVDIFKTTEGRYERAIILLEYCIWVAYCICGREKTIQAINAVHRSNICGKLPRDMCPERYLTWYDEQYPDTSVVTGNSDHAQKIGKKSNFVGPEKYLHEILEG